MLRPEDSGMIRVALAALVVAGSTLAQPPAGSAAGPPSATDQYRETIPNGTGGSPVGGAGHPNAKVVIPPPIAHAITRSGGRDAPLLRKVTTSPSFGAVPTSPQSHAEAQVLHTRTPSAVSAAFGAIGDRSFLSLLVPLAVVSGAALVASTARRRWR